MQDELLSWYDRNRRDFPWRRTKDPYAIWLSEIMLQQTRAETGLPYWQRFMAQFPTLSALALAEEREVLKLWEGLGYYSRAKNLLRCARLLMNDHGGVFPEDAASLMKLPGIGAYTAGAIASIVFAKRVPAIDGNVKRVVARLKGIRENIDLPHVQRRLQMVAADLVPENRPGDFNQAMMELGARVCQPAARCGECPVSAHCDAYAMGDADSLPVKRRKAPPKTVDTLVILVFFQDRVLVCRREERLLNGLWCFPVVEADAKKEEADRYLISLGIDADYVDCIGTARHIFTHRVWEMSLLQYRARSERCPDGWLWADSELLTALPLPTAVKAARSKAMVLLA